MGNIFFFFFFFPFSTQYVYYAEVLNWDCFSVLSCGTVGVNLFFIKAGCVYFMVQTCTFCFCTKVILKNLKLYLPNIEKVMVCK